MTTTEHLLTGDERVDFHASPNQISQFAGHRAVSSEADYDTISGIRSDYVHGMHKELLSAPNDGSVEEGQREGRALLLLEEALHRQRIIS